MAIETNKQYVDDKVNSLEKLMNAELKAIREAVNRVEVTNSRAIDKVEATNQDYRATQNEWRGQIKDQTGMFVTRRELWAAVIAILGLVGAALGLLK